MFYLRRCPLISIILLMIRTETSRIAEELDTKGYTLTSYDKLGLPFDPSLVGKLCTAAAGGTFSAAAADLTKHIEKSGMAMVQDESALVLGRQLVRPVVESLFADSPKALAGWNLYAMNRYDAPGASLGSHQDSVGSTVLVVTASGKRDFNIHERPSFNGEQTPITETIQVVPGDIMILDAQADPAHSVACVEAPSVSAVLDVPDMLRPVHVG
jgi:hypothetical protein